MAGGKKAKPGGTAEQKQAVNASPPTQRNTAFIETAGASQRVFPREVRDAIYRYLLLGRNVKKHRDSGLWDTKGWADYYNFEVNILRANKAVYAEGKRRAPDLSLHSGHFADLCRHSEQQEKSCMERTRSLSCQLKSPRSLSRSSFTPFPSSLRTSLLLTASPSTVST
jgi:hypothetical protein